MGDKTGIEWTDATWNPTTGCDRVSPGCDHCYALTMAKRLKGMGVAAYQADGDPVTSGPGFKLTVHEDRLDQPLRWTKPRRIFVNSMSDLFHADVPDEFLARTWAVMLLARQHTFQVLTKRHGRLRSLLSSDRFRDQIHVAATSLMAEHHIAEGRSFPWPVPNVWVGVSVEDQKWADVRIPALLATPAAVRFLSMEPLLGPVDLLGDWTAGCDYVGPAVTHEGRSTTLEPGLIEYDCEHQAGVDWVIVGGESGAGARPMHPQWVRDLRNQCLLASVPFLFKQWGSWRPQLGGPTLVQQSTGDTLPADTELLDETLWAGVAPMGKHDAGRELDGRTWDEYPASLAV